MNRKQTAWKKSRKFGDVYGGRERIKLSDNIFARAHSLKKPETGEELPILIEENPSRDYFFPVSAEETLEVVKSLPKRDYEGLTHIWLRRNRKTKSKTQDLPLAEFVCGSGVRAVILYPWRRDLIQEFGADKPGRKIVAEYRRYFTAELKKVDNSWILKWQIEPLRRFLIDVIFHEVGHHVDQYFRHWSKANRKQVEEYADQYAFQKAATARHVFNKIQKSTQAD